MKPTIALKGLACLLVTVHLLSSVASAAEVYKLSGVKRIDNNLYKADGGLIIQTQLCLHLALSEDAILKWDGPISSDNKIIWDDDSTCEVKKIMSTK
jgi:hypothetical protein